MSHTTMVEFPCHPGKGVELLGLLAAALGDTRAFDGCESIEVYTDQEEPDRIVLWEKWETRGKYEAYLAWRMETGLADLLTPLMDPANLRIVHLEHHDV